MSRSRLVVACATVAVIAVSVASAAPPGGGAKVSLSISDVAAAEGNSGTRAFVFTVTASGSLKGSAGVSFGTADGTADAGDYVPTSGTLSFDRTAKSRTVMVQVSGDNLDELDETFHVVLSNPSGATIADGTGVGTILDDDSPPVEGVRIAAAGDIACDPGSSNFNGGQGSGLTCRQMATSDLLVGAGYAAVLLLGDIQYEDGAYSKFLASYNPSWGRVKSITKPAPGNHEYQSGTAAGYYQYFGSAAGDPTKGYYSYDLGGWHIVALNSNCSFVGGCGAGSPQELWLRADLAAHPASCTLAYWHHPRFSSGSHGNDTTYTAFWQALYDANADLVLVGHDHDYERFAPQTPGGALDPARGIRQIVAGSGGKEVRGFSTIRANSEARNASSLGVLELTLGASAYEWRYRAAVGSFADNGSASCH